MLAGVAASRTERLAEFLRRLTDAPPAASAGEARELLASILNAVEDELSGVPFDLTKWQSDGRMYPPQDDSKRQVPGYSNVTRFRSRGHNTFICTNGAIEIAEVGGAVLLRKSGVDGKHVWET